MYFFISLLLSVRNMMCRFSMRNDESRAGKSTCFCLFSRHSHTWKTRLFRREFLLFLVKILLPPEGAQRGTNIAEVFVTHLWFTGGFLPRLVRLDQCQVRPASHVGSGCQVTRSPLCHRLERLGEGFLDFVVFSLRAGYQVKYF